MERQPPNDEFPLSVGNYLLRFARRLAGLTIEEVAGSNLSRGYLGRLEQGVSRLTIAQVPNVARCYGLTTGIVSLAFDFTKEELINAGIGYDPPAEQELLLINRLEQRRNLDDPQVAAAVMNEVEDILRG